MIPAFTFWLLWLSLANHATAKDNRSLKCTFVVNQLEFDLCPLIDAHSTPFEIIIDKDTPPTHTKHIYAVSLGGPLKRDMTLPAELQCPEDTHICLTVVNTRPNHPSEPSRILQVVPVAGGDLNPTAILGTKTNEEDHHAPLQLTLHGGSYTQISQKATFIFDCDHNAEEPSMPSSRWVFNGSHAFSWRTKHACHKPLAEPQPDPGPDPDPPQELPKDPDSNPDGETDTENPPSRSNFKLFLFFWIVVLGLVLTRLLPWLRKQPQYHHLTSSISSRFQRLHSRFPLSRRFLSWSPYAKYKPITNRSSSSRNASYSYPPDEYEDDGEEVPLTPSPRGTFGGSTRGSGHYGSF